LKKIIKNRSVVWLQQLLRYGQSMSLPRVGSIKKLGMTRGAGTSAETSFALQASFGWWAV